MNNKELEALSRKTAPRPSPQLWENIERQATQTPQETSTPGEPFPKVIRFRRVYGLVALLALVVAGSVLALDRAGLPELHGDKSAPAANAGIQQEDGVLGGSEVPTDTTAGMSNAPSTAQTTGAHWTVSSPAPVSSTAEGVWVTSTAAATTSQGKSEGETSLPNAPSWASTSGPGVVYTTTSVTEFVCNSSPAPGHAFTTMPALETTFTTTPDSETAFTTTPDPEAAFTTTPDSEAVFTTTPASEDSRTECSWGTILRPPLSTLHPIISLPGKPVFSSTEGPIYTIEPPPATSYEVMTFTTTPGPEEPPVS